MKKLLFLLSIINYSLLISNCSAQVPNAIPYQGVARNAAGNIIASQLVSLRISIHNATAAGTVVYSETHNTTTTALGLFSVNIGGGTVSSGTFATINWASGAKFLQVEMDVTGGSSYADMGTTQLNSVPYALFSGNSSDNKWTASGTNIYNNNTGNVSIGTTTPAAATKLTVVKSQGSGLTLLSGDTHFTSMGIGRTSSELTMGVAEATNNFMIGASAGDAVLRADNSSNKIVMGAGVGANASMVVTGSNVGIGTTAPQAKLDVAGTFKMADGSQAANKILTSDNSGLASWKELKSLVSSSTSLSCISQVSSLGNSMGNRDIVVSGSRAYVVGNNGFNIFNISTPSSISLMSSRLSGSLSVGIAVSGNYACVTSVSDDRLWVFDISNAANPILRNTGGTFIAQDPQAVAMQGNYVYVTSYNGGLLYIYDISNPASPVLVNSGGTNIGANCFSIRVSGNYAYVLTDRILVYNISNPALPVLVNTTNAPIGTSPSNMQVSGSYAYVLDNTENKLRIVDVSNPASPVLKNGAGIQTSANPQRITVLGNYAYVVNHTANNFEIFDITDKSNPVLKNSGGTATGTQPFGIAASGNYAYVVTYGSEDIRAYNVLCSAVTAVTFNESTGAISSQPITWTTSGNYITNVNNANVGIGTSNPATAKLVFGGTAGSQGIDLSSADMYANMRVIQNSNGSTDKDIYIGYQSGTTSSLHLYSNNGETVTVANGSMGIGQTSPQAPLHITGTGITAANQARTYFTLNTAITSGTGSSGNILVRADGWFWANGGGFVATSDKRIKNILGRTDNKKDLETISQIIITDYKYIDEVSNGSGLQKKLIAQELKEIYPTAVNQNEGVIPNVYETAKALEVIGNSTIISTSKAHGFKTGDVVKLILSKAGEKMFVVAVIDEQRFRVEEKISDQVFVYGKNVKDLLNVDYDAVSMLNVSATQELYKLTKELQQANEALKARLKELEEKFKAIQLTAPVSKN